MSAARTLLLALLSCACRAASAPAEPAITAPPAVEAADAWGSVLLDTPPHVRQEPDFCGEACVEMVLRGMGHEVDAATDEVIYHEPAEDDGASRRMRRADLYAAWPLHGRSGAALIRLRLLPQALQPPVPATGRGPAAYAQHVQALREKLPSGFTVAVEPPFVVVGDEAPERVQARAEGTVRAYARALERDFFQQQPAEIFTIWLFKDAASYQRYTWELWRERPDTPYGYATEDGNRLVMDISTGGGTLVHELVHAYVHTDFPGCPTWLDEGLASLFEHVSLEDGHPMGHTNWRLDGLLSAIRAGVVPSFRWLTSQTSRQFYREDPGTNYAQSRYLCQYAQEQGLLRELYRRARERHAQDPTGYDTLTEVLGVEDQAVFLERWQAWAVGLRELPDGG